MHYYKRNLGDYAKKCGRLSMLQHGAYTLLIDSCYDRERFPTLEEAIEWTWASTEAEIEAVKFVLSRFFKLNDEEQYVQERIRCELADYHAKADKNKQIAIERETKRKQNSTNRAQVVHETPPNQEPLTNNHKPITNIKENIKEKKAATPQKPTDVSEQVWKDFVEARKKKKAIITQNVIEGLRKKGVAADFSLEQVLSTIVERGWAGFEASWVTKQGANGKQGMTFAERDQEQRKKDWEQMTGRKWPENESIHTIIDVKAEQPKGVTHDTTNQSD